MESPSRERVIVPIDEYGVPTSDASALLARLSTSGIGAIDFFISYQLQSDWRHVRANTRKMYSKNYHGHVRKNAKSRKCQTIPHTCGSKGFARRRAEMEKIIHEMGQSSNSDSQFVSHDDALGKVFGKEHPGRVRALGFEPCPSTVFKGTSRVNVANDCQMRDYMASLEKELAATKSILEAQNHKVEAQNLQMEDMKKTLGGALVTVFENALGKVPK
ncbi:hypothetical protein DH2020_006452 [Rehmannia glutinosa]|uniref:Uncharacterized protein n=1 Tax=Rehmannia glutinosa TaxID=99300 RepID=A0ABR0XJ21_REHGL